MIKISLNGKKNVSLLQFATVFYASLNSQTDPVKPEVFPWVLGPLCLSGNADQSFWDLTPTWSSPLPILDRSWWINAPTPSLLKWDSFKVCGPCCPHRP